MSLTDILQKIAAEAQVEIDKIQDQLAADKKALDADSAEIAKAESADLDQKTKDALQSVDDKTASMARRQNRERMLAVKREMIDKAMQGLLDAIEGADDSVYTDIITKLIKGLPFAEGTLHVPAKREAVTKKAAGAFSVTVDKNLTGGFIADGPGTTVDNSFHNLIFSEYRAELEMHFANQLKLV